MKNGGVPSKKKIRIVWSRAFAYAIGLLATDGNLGLKQKHITLTSNDKEQIVTFKQCLGLSNKISRNISGTSKKVGFRIQFSDIVFYKFLIAIGITPKKSKTIGKIKIPKKYFFDFLRGAFDGDGSFHSYYDKRWKSSFMMYVYFYSASLNHIQWLRSEIKELIGIEGYITKNRKDSVVVLRYAKKESFKLLLRMYRHPFPSLSRKYLKINKALGILSKPI
jgi:hypothetical protein